MDQIREWATILCVTSVASGILIFIIPDGKLKKTAEIVVSLFLMLSLVSLFSDKYDFPDYKDNDFSFRNESYSVDFDNYIVEQSKKTSEDIIASVLAEICSSNFAVNTQWHVDGGNICLDSVEILIDASDMSKTGIIKSKIGALTGIVPEVNVR